MHNDLFYNNMPGTILKDVEYFLNFIEEKNLEITGDRGLLPNHCLPVMNSHMSHPLKLKLKRDQQLSYPHISAIYLLCRTLGIVQITWNKSKRLLTIDKEILNTWKSLNETEKYFNLMQTWLFRSDERLINQGRSYSICGIFNDVLHFIQHKVKNELTFKNVQDQKNQLYSIKLYNLALLEMFDVISIEDQDGISEKNWLISKISITDFGKKWINIFHKNKDINPDLIIHMIDDKEKCIDQFYQGLKIFFPHWKICLKPKKKITDERVHIFKISIRNNIWRRISIQGSEFLDVLADSILDAFKFDNDHLYRFSYTDRFGVFQSIHHYYCEEPPSCNEVRVGDIDILMGDSIEFLYDFGDSWKFNIQLEKIDPDVIIHGSKIIEIVGEAPEQYPDFEYS